MKKVKIFALIAAIITAALLFVFLNSLNNDTKVVKTSVVVAVQDIPADTPITESMINVSKLPREIVLNGAISDSSLVLGKVAKSEIFTGEQIIPGKLVTAGDANESSLSYVIKPGMRAITIAVDGVSGLAYMITPGNDVDIIAQYSLQKANQSVAIPFSKLIVENVTVLAVDSVLSEQGKIGGTDASYLTITLQVTPEQALNLSLYEYTGKLCAVLRSPLDDKMTNLKSITMN